MSDTRRCSSLPRRGAPLFGLACAMLLATSASAQQPAPPAPEDKHARAEAILKSIQWTVGPAKAQIGDNAELPIPEGYVFTGAAGTRKMLELMENPTDGRELGLLTPKTMAWFMIFEFSSIGYVKDADKEELDGEEILDSIREGTKASNEERKRRGWPTIEIVGWQTAPFFDKATKNLKWCIKGQSQGKTIVNYNTRILGRRGVMSANLLVAPDKLETTLPEIKTLLGGFAFKDGERYAEYKSGDKIAEYGLTALVVGGAAGIAAKVGLFGKLFGFLGKMWKLLIIGLLAIGAGLKSLLSRKPREPEVATAQGAPPEEPPAQP